MLIVLVFFALVLVTAFAWAVTRNDGWGIAFVFSFAAFILFAAMPLCINQLCERGHIREFEAVRQTAISARNNPDISPLELAAMQQRVIDSNKWLSSVQFYAKNPLTSWFVPRAVLKLEPIR